MLSIVFYILPRDRNKIIFYKIYSYACQIKTRPAAPIFNPIKLTRTLHRRLVSFCFLLPFPFCFLFFVTPFFRLTPDPDPITPWPWSHYYLACTLTPLPPDPDPWPLIPLPPGPCCSSCCLSFLTAGFSCSLGLCGLYRVSSWAYIVLSCLVLCKNFVSYWLWSSVWHPKSVVIGYPVLLHLAWLWFPSYRYQSDVLPASVYLSYCFIMGWR